MSYSFSTKAPTKAEVMTAVASEFDKVVNAQPIHAVDRQAAERAVKAFVDMVRDPEENENIAISVSGSVQWRDANNLSAGNQVFIGVGNDIKVYVS